MGAVPFDCRKDWPPPELGDGDTLTLSANEYVRDDVTTNRVEGFYSIFKGGMKGVYQHCKEEAFAPLSCRVRFRYSNRVKLGVNDGERAVLAMKGIEGKRLTYRPTIRKISTATGA